MSLSIAGMPRDARFYSASLPCRYVGRCSNRSSVFFFGGIRSVIVPTRSPRGSDRVSTAAATTHPCRPKRPDGCVSAGSALAAASVVQHDHVLAKPDEKDWPRSGLPARHQNVAVVSLAATAPNVEPSELLDPSPIIRQRVRVVLLAWWPPRRLPPSPRGWPSDAPCAPLLRPHGSCCVGYHRAAVPIVSQCRSGDRLPPPRWQQASAARHSCHLGPSLRNHQGRF